MPRKTSSPRRKSPKSLQYESELKRDIESEGRKIGEMASKVYNKNSTQGIPFAGSKTAAALAQAFEEPVAYSATDLQEELENDTGDCINKLSMYSVEPNLFNLTRPGDVDGKVERGELMHLDERAAVMASVGASQVLCDILHGVRSKTITLQSGVDKKLIYIEDLIEHIHDRHGAVITLEKDTTSVLDRVSRDQRVNLERHLVKQLFENVVESVVEAESMKLDGNAYGAGKFVVTRNDFFFEKFKNMVKVRSKAVGKSWESNQAKPDAIETHNLQIAYDKIRAAMKDFMKGSPRVMFRTNLKMKVGHAEVKTGETENVTPGPVLITKEGMHYAVSGTGHTAGGAKQADVGAETFDITDAKNDYVDEMVSHIFTIIAAHVLTYSNTAATDFIIQLGQKANDGKIVFEEAGTGKLSEELACADEKFNGTLTNAPWKDSNLMKGDILDGTNGSFNTLKNLSSGKDKATLVAEIENNLKTPTTNAHLADTAAKKAFLGIILRRLETFAGTDKAAVQAYLTDANFSLTRSEIAEIYVAGHPEASFLVPHTVFAPGLLAALELYKVGEGRFDDEMALQLNTNKEVKELFKAAHKSYDMDDESSGAKSYVRATDTTPAWLMSAEDKLKYEQQFEKIKEYSGKTPMNAAAVANVRTSNSAAQLAEAYTKYRDTQGVAKRLGSITSGFGRRRRRSSKRKASFGRRKRRTSKRKASFGRKRRTSKKKASFGRKRKSGVRRR